MNKKKNFLILFIFLIIIIIIISISIILIIFLFKNKFNENFNTKEADNRLILLKNPSILLENNYFNHIYFTYLTKIFPFDIIYYTIDKSSYNKNTIENINFTMIINKLNNFEIDFGTIDEPLLNFYVYKTDNLYKKSLILTILDDKIYKFYDYNNIRFVSTLYTKYLLFISNKNLEIYNSYEIKEKKIGILKHSNDYIYLKLYLFSKQKLDNEIYIYETQKLLEIDYKKGVLDIIFICSTLNTQFLNLFKEDSIILDCLNDTEDEIVSQFIPNTFKSQKLLNNFKYNKNKYINLLSIRYFLISNIKTYEWIIYLFLYRYYNNLNYLQLKTEKENFNGNINFSIMYYIVSKIKYHKGAKNFYQNKGLITIKN